MFLKKKDFGGSKYDFIIAGLGNPGAKYEMTRHNACLLYTSSIPSSFIFAFEIKSLSSANLVLRNETSLSLPRSCTPLYSLCLLYTSSRACRPYRWIFSLGSTNIYYQIFYGTYLCAYYGKSN